MKSDYFPQKIKNFQGCFVTLFQKAGKPCVYDPDPGRQGYRDALHIINKIYHHYSACAVIGNRWEVLYPMEWTTQEEDTHPYYFTAMSLRIQAPAVHKEVPEA